MERVLEPEVMDDPRQAQVYAQADFSAVNEAFVRRLLERFPAAREAHVVDLGCGPADIPLRLARAAPRACVTGVDASLPMLRLAQALIARAGGARIRLVCARLPSLPLLRADAVVSNSLLHHLADPAPFWREVRRVTRPGGAVFVMDLFRPDSADAARAIVERAAPDEDALLKEDFFNSLLAAFTPVEVRAQLVRAGLGHLDCSVASERHLLVTGTL